MMISTMINQVFSAHKIFPGLVVGIFVSLVFSCSRQSEQIVDTSDYYANNQDPVLILKTAECTKKRCDPVSMDSRIEGLSQGVFRGLVGQPLTWKIQGFDPATEKERERKNRRKVVVLLNKIPENAKIFPGPDSKVPLASLATVEWVPRTPQEGWLEIILRDFDRCMALEAVPSTCQKYNMLADYDTRQQAVPWLILSNSGQISEGTSGPPVGSPSLSQGVSSEEI